MKTLMIALAVSVASASPALAQRPMSDQVTLKVRPGDEAKPRGERLFCAKQGITGSRIPATVCRTLAEWKVTNANPRERNRNAD